MELSPYFIVNIPIDVELKRPVFFFKISDSFSFEHVIVLPDAATKK
ncbi:MAG: hypothetical protein JW982_05245 [Spirochaetes bacterium]|nr:hypothetical protein [Spirochaetota bacterium]